VNPLPVKTDVTYFGVKQEVAVGWAFPLGDGRLEPFAGLGYRWWLRDLQDSTASNGTATVAVSGYTEEWESLYTKAGMAVSHPLQGDWQLYAEAGGKYPFYNTNTVDIVGVGRTTVRPEPRWSAFAEIGARYRRFRPAIFYEGYRTGQSPVVRISPTTGILQPQSNEDVVGVSFSYCFR
ncbi:MAG TPA: autotransporter domain-containing protein, partial [Streptosporangiaceae bacterium]